MPDQSTVDTQPPTQLWIGKIDRRWPLYAFADEAAAIFWLGNPKDDERRRLWQASVVFGDELKLIAPPAYLEPIGADTTGGDADG